ncbi:MAG TPA: hypothetical protein VF035_08235 [Longimicrobiales bacterium]
MHILLTDVLTCPRCGPEFGLILLAERMGDRRVEAGRLGCANCREQFGAASDGVWLVPEGRERRQGKGSGEGKGPGERGEGDTVRIAALLAASSGYLLLLGDAAEGAEGVADLLEGVEVIPVVPPGASTNLTSGPRNGEWGVSVVRAEGVPVATGKMAGVALLGARADELLEEAARTVRPTGRLLVDPAPADARERLAKAGLRVLAEEGSTLLAIRG